MGQPEKARDGRLRSARNDLLLEWEKPEVVQMEDEAVRKGAGKKKKNKQQQQMRNIEIREVE